MVAMTHKNANIVLAVLVALLGLYIIVLPILPNLTFKVKQGSYKAPAYVQAAQSGSAVSPDTIPAGNRLAIPKLGIEAPILEGIALNTVDKGLWHRPNTPTPLENGNTVIVGHRFSYNPGLKQPFYHLDKLGIGDTIVVAWEKKIVTYKVSEIKTVTADQVVVEQNTTDKRLTLYTCTPLWNPVNRLVIIAKPVKGIL